MSPFFRRPPFLRLILAGSLVAAGVSTGCGSLRVDSVPSENDRDWLTEGDSPHRQYVIDVELSPPLEEVWSYNASAAFGPGSPLLLGDYVIVATRKGEIHLIDFATGKRRGIKEFGDSVEGTPAIQDGIIYIPVAWGKRSLYAHDLTRGERLWSLDDAPIESGILIAGDHVVAVDTEGYARGLDPSSGRVEWEVALDSTAAMLASPVAVGEDVFALADDDGEVVALDPIDGSEVWRANVGAPVQATPSSNDQRLFVPTTRGRLVALDSNTGDVQWTYAIEDATVYFSTPAVSEKEVVFGASDGLLRSLDPETGKLQWTFDAGEGFPAAPLIAKNTIYAGGLDGKLYAVDRSTGKLLWEHQLEGRIKSAFAARGEYIVITSEPKNVYLFKAVEPEEYARAK